MQQLPATLIVFSIATLSLKFSVFSSRWRNGKKRCSLTSGGSGCCHFTTCQLKTIWNLIQEHSEDNCKFSSAEKRALNPSGGQQYGFQVTGMIKGFFSLSNFRFRDLFG